MLDHCNPGTALLRSFLLQGQTKRRLLSLRARRLQVIATIFAGVPRGGGITCVRKTAGLFPCRLCMSNKLVRFPGFGSKGSAGDDGFTRNHGKVRIKPRHCGCGRHRHGAEAAACGRSDIRHPHCRHAAAGFASQAAADGGREETR
jgi:hypothetical protein